MADGDAQLQVGVSVVGAPESAAAIGSVSDAIAKTGNEAEVATPKANALLEDLGNRRGSQRAAMELFEVLRGGGATVEGVTGLMRMLLLTAEGLDPLLLGLSLVGLSLTGVFAKHDDVNSPKDKADDAKKALDGEKQSIDDLEKQASASYPTILQQLKLITEEMDKQVEAQKALQHAKDEFQDAALAGKIADLDDQEQKDLVGKSESEQAGIKRDYERRRLALRTEVATQKAADEVLDKQAAEQAARDALNDQKNKIEAQQQRLTQAYGVVNGGAAAEISQAGVKSDAQAAADRLAELDQLHSGNRLLTADETMERENLQGQVPILQDRERVSGPSFKGQVDDLTNRLKAAQDAEKADLSRTLWGSDGKIPLPPDYGDAQIQRETQVSLQAALDAIAKYQADMDAANKVLEKEVPDFRKLNDDIPTLQTKIAVASIETETAQRKLENVQISQHAESAKLTAQQVREIAKEEFDKREAERQAKEKTLQTQLGDPNLPAADREQIQQRIAGISAQGDKDKLDNSTALGLPDAEIIKLRAAQTNVPTAAGFKVETEKERSLKEQGAEQERDLKQQVAELKKQIEGRPDHAALEPLVRSIESMGSSVAEVPQLQSVLATQVGQLAARVDQKTSNLARDVSQAKRDIQDLTHKINETRNQQ